METLSAEEARRVMAIQEQLGATTPRGTITNDKVRVVTLFKETQSTRLGIIFHQNTPDELSDADKTPRGGADAQHVVIPIIKVLDKSGIAGNCKDLSEGDQVLSVNGQAALSNIQVRGPAFIRLEIQPFLGESRCLAARPWCARLGSLYRLAGRSDAP